MPAEPRSKFTLAEQGTEHGCPSLCLGPSKWHGFAQFCTENNTVASDRDTGVGSELMGWLGVFENVAIPVQKHFLFNKVSVSMIRPRLEIYLTRGKRAGKWSWNSMTSFLRLFIYWVVYWKCFQNWWFSCLGEHDERTGFWADVDTFYCSTSS